MPDESDAFRISGVELSGRGTWGKQGAVLHEAAFRRGMDRAQRQARVALAAADNAHYFRSGRTKVTALAPDQAYVLLDSGTWLQLDHERFDQLRVLIEEARALADKDGHLRLNRWQAGLWDSPPTTSEDCSTTDRAT